MRADAHYVDTLDAPPRRAHAATVVTRTSTAVLENLVDEALRGITAAAALDAAASPVVRNGAAEIMNVEAHRALRLLTAVRVVRGESPVHRTTIRIGPALATLVRAIERELHLCRMAPNVTLTVDETLVVDGSEELLLTAAYAIITAFGTTVPPSTSRTLQIAATADSHRQTLVLDIREHGLSLPESWTRLDEPWPVPSGGAAVMLLGAARTIAEWHGGSLSIHTGRTATNARVSLAAMHNR